MKGFLNYIPGNSILHRLDPRTKILLSLMVCIGCFSAHNIFILIGFIIFDMLLGIIGGIPKQAFGLLKGILKFSILLFILQLLFIRSGEPLFNLVPGFPITKDGLLIAAQVVLRLMGATLPLAMMLLLTDLNDLSGAMVSKCRIPYKYAFAVTSAIRFIPSFSNDMADIIEAQTARGVEFDTKNIFKKIGLVVPLCVPLLVSSVGKIESASIAAELRGFNLRTKDSGYKKFKFRLCDYIFFLVGFAIIALGIIL